jgi:hypothetical protein
MQIDRSLNACILQPGQPLWLEHRGSQFSRSLSAKLLPLCKRLGLVYLKEQIYLGGGMSVTAQMFLDLKDGKTRKQFAQHWLKSDKALNQIIRAAEVNKCDRVLEIGPGTGILTRRLLPSPSLLLLSKLIEICASC